MSSSPSSAAHSLSPPPSSSLPSTLPPPLFSVALVCQSNVNRSMAAHEILQSLPINIASYGIGSKVRLPGETQHTPNVFEFGTPYTTMIKQLTQKNEQRYTANGILPMLKRDSLIKLAPERWISDNVPYYHLVITYEDRVYDTLITSLSQHLSYQHRISHIINIQTTDNTTEANVSATLTLQLIESFIAMGNEWEEHIENIMDKWEQDTGRKLIHQIWWY